MLALVLAAALGLPAAAFSQSNLLTNGGFEGTYSIGAAPGWNKFPIRGLYRGSLSESAITHGGAKSQEMSLTETMGAWLQCSAPISGGIVAGQDYVATVWVKGERQIQQDVSLVAHDNTAWFPNTYASCNFCIGPTWQQLTLRFRAPKTDATARIAVKLGQEGNIWVDDATVQTLAAGPISTPPVGNIVRNGSFETGSTSWIAAGGSFSVVADATAPNGGNVLKSPWGGISRTIETVCMTAPSGANYVLSLWMRSASASTVTTKIRDGESVLASADFSVGTTWQRFTLPIALPPLPDGQFHLTITPGSTDLYVDAVQFEAGTVATAFQPRAVVEAGLSIDNSGAIVSPGTAVTGTLTLFNNSATALPETIRCRVFDLWERVAAQQTLNVSANPGQTKIAVTLTPGALLGAFRAQCDVADDVRPPYAEATFTVLPPKAGNFSPFGTAIDFSSPSLVSQAGSGRSKSWYLSWGSVHPNSTTWNYNQDTRFNGWITAGMAPMAILSEAIRSEQAVPANPVSWGWYNCSNYADMQEYAHGTVAHYGDRIDTWELQNEPNQSLHPQNGESKAQAYSHDAVALARGVHQANPQLHILMGGGMTMGDDPEVFLKDAFTTEPELQTLCDSVSYHNYNGDPAVTHRTVSRIQTMLQGMNLQKYIYDTEWAPVTCAESFKRDANRHNFDTHASARRSTTQVVTGFICRLGEGVKNSFLYAAYGGGDVNGSFDNYQDMDGKPRPTFAAQAAMAIQLNAVTNPEILTVSGCWAYRFLRPDNHKVSVFWADDFQPAPVVVTLSADAEIFDMMGNSSGVALAGETINVGPEPIYVVNSYPHDPMLFETENLTVVATSGDTERIIMDPAFSGGNGTILDATSTGDFVTYLAPGIAAGNYKVRVGVKNYNSRGQWQLAIGPAGSGTPTNLGAVYDEYSANAAFTEIDLGAWSPVSTSDKWFRFKVTGKNAASSGYTIAFDYIRLVPLQ